MDLATLFMSFLVGVLIGLTSMGGAALMAPFLILVLGVPPAAGVQTDLIYGSITKIVGAVVHWRQGTVDWQVARKMALGSIPGGLAGSVVLLGMARNGTSADAFLKRAIGIALVTVAVFLLIRLFGTWREFDSSPYRDVLLGWPCVAWGAMVGFCVGLTSVGSGSLVAPFLFFLFPSHAAKVVGTDVMHAALLVTATGLIHVSLGGVNWPLVATLVCGSVPGVIIGSRMAPRIPTRLLRTALAVLLMATGIKMA